jgi:hypothetical protein
MDGYGDFRPTWNFCFYFLFVLYPTFCPDCRGFAFCPSLYNTHNTNIHVPSGIRILNPSKRSTPDPRLRPLGHWDRQGFEPATPAGERPLTVALDCSATETARICALDCSSCSESLYRLSYGGIATTSLRPRPWKMNSHHALAD